MYIKCTCSCSYFEVWGRQGPIACYVCDKALVKSYRSFTFHTRERESKNNRCWVFLSDWQRVDGFRSKSILLLVLSWLEPHCRWTFPLNAVGVLLFVLCRCACMLHQCINLQNCLALPCFMCCRVQLLRPHACQRTGGPHLASWDVLRIGVENRCWECFGIYFESWPVMELIHVTVIHVISRKQPSTWPCLGAQLLWGHRDPALRGQAMWDLYTIVHCTSLYTVQIRTAKCSQLNCENIQYIHLVSFSSVLPTFESATSHDIINIHKWHTVNVIKLYIIYIYIMSLFVFAVYVSLYVAPRHHKDPTVSLSNDSRACGSVWLLWLRIQCPRHPATA